ncbi:MAG: NAD(P)-dependent oxidoreductase [Dehalococcoidia bacterium]
MRVAFLDPLEPRLAEFPGRYLGTHEILLTEAAGVLPPGVADAEAVVWWSYPVDRSLIAALPRLRFMQRVGVTRYKGDATAALERGIPVSAFALGVSDRVAQHTLALTLAVLRRLPAGDRAVRDGLNPDNLPERETGAPAEVNWARLPNIETLNDKAVGIIGFGEIGACYARMLAPFNCRVLYHKRHRMSPAHERFFDVTYADLDDLLRRSDIVASFVPYTEQSRKMLGERELGLLKPTAVFVNTGRGNTVDEAALVRVLQQGRIAGAGLDVFAVEPLPAASPLRALDNVVLTPHSAGGIQGWVNVFERIAENLRRVERGEPILLPLRSDDPGPIA